MAEKDEKAAAAAAAAAPAKSGPGMVGWVVVGVLSVVGGATGAFLGQKKAAQAVAIPTEMKEGEEKGGAPPTELTLKLDPFLVTILDEQRKSHVLKVSLAIEFEESKKKEEKPAAEGEEKKDPLAIFVPRLRDAGTAFFSSMTFSDATSCLRAENRKKVKEELLKAFKESGATDVKNVLITDFVVQ